MGEIDFASDHAFDASDPAVHTQSGGRCHGLILEKSCNSWILMPGGNYRLLALREIGWCAICRELPAACHFIKRFRQAAVVRPLVLFIDNRWPMSALHSKPERHCLYELTHLEYTSQLTTCLHQIRRKSNCVPEKLPGPQRKSVNCRPRPYPMAVIEAKNKSLIEAAQILSLKYRQAITSANVNAVLCGMSTGLPQPIVPCNCPRLACDTFHGLPHPFIAPSA